MLATYVLHITKECNMRCMYCYEKDKTSTYTWDEIKVLLDDIVAHNKHFNLEFLGGEPCLRTDLIAKTIEYLNGMDDVEVGSYFITTNGTIVNDELISILKTNDNVSWSASIDGHKFGNFMRIMKSGHNSYDIVVANMKRLKDALGEKAEKCISCHLVTHPYNIGYLADGIKSLYDEGFRNFGIGTIESTMIIDNAYCKEFILQHRILSNMVIDGKLPGIMIGLFEGVKPESDERHYIKDDSGKVILETYGRVENDIKDTDKYKTSPSTSLVSDKINGIRFEAYQYHNDNLKRRGVTSL